MSGESPLRGPLQLGREPARRWRYRRSAEPSVLTPEVEVFPGHMLAKEPVGFPYAVTLRHPGEGIADAAKLRLMKALALALAQQQAGQSEQRRVKRLVIELGEATGDSSVRLVESSEPEQPPVLHAAIPSSWLGEHDGSLERLRRAALALARSGLAGPTGGAPPSIPPLPSWSDEPLPPAKVLFFSNPFELDVDHHGASAQINPGIHYLVSRLRQRGATTLLLEAKHPLQDVCERPPEVTTELTPEQCISHPEALAELLEQHPDLSLVCLTVLERTFAQVRDLCRFIRERSSAFIAVGGVTATHLPEQCFVHLPEANLIVRGDGEEVLPQIVRAVAGHRAPDGLPPSSIALLETIPGLIARFGEVVVSNALDEVNRVRDIDQSTLDYSVLAEHNVRGGLSISTSRGCIYGCRFCSVMDRQLWRAKQPDAVARLLDDYRARLAELFGSAEAAPAAARSLQVWDDDFFIHPERAAAILRAIAERGFTVSFIQGTVSSFFVRQGRKMTDELHGPLIDALPAEVFTEIGGLKLGTENFCDDELQRLGKPYRYHHVRKLVLALAERGIQQDHYLVLCNRQTTLGDLLDNFEKIAELRWRVGGSFNVLSPSWLMDLFPTVLYQSRLVQGTEQGLPNIGVLQAPGYPELDYPHIVPDRPERDEVFDVARRFPSGMHFGAAGAPNWQFAGIYEPSDEDYLRVFEHLRRALEERREALQGTEDLASQAELLRVQQALQTRLDPPRTVTTGLLRRLAPRLQLSPPAEHAPGLAGYLEALLRGGAERPSSLQLSVEPEPQGARLVAQDGATRVEFRVQPVARGGPHAFATLNLAFIVESPERAGAQRDRQSALIEAVRALVERRDVHPLQ